MNPKFFYFDLGNVLLHFDYAIACRNLASLTGITVEDARQGLLDSGLEERYERGELSSQQFHRTFCEATGTRPPLPEFLVASSDMFQLNTAVVPIVAQLRGAGYPLGIISNTCDAHWQFISNGRYTLLRRFFLERVLSFEVECMKPDRRIFDVAVERAGYSPESIFFVDDRPQNVSGAASAGLDAVLYKSADDLVRQLIGRGVRANL